MAKFIQALVLAFVVLAMIVPNDATFFKHKSYAKHPVYVQKYQYVPVVHQPVYYKAVPVYVAPRKKFYKKKHYKG